MALSLPIYFLGNTYVVHFRVQGKQIKRTLRTADPRIAKLRAIKLMETVRMAIKGGNPDVSDFDFSGKLSKYKLNPQTGQMETDGTQQDHENLMAAIDRIGAISGAFQRTPQPSAPASGSSPKLHEVELTLTQFLTKFLSMKKKLSAGTKTDYEATVKQFDEWAGTPVMSQIDADKITAYMEWLSERGNTERTVDKKVGTLRALFNFAIKQHYIVGENPAAERNLLSRKQKNAGGLNFFKLEDIKQMYDCDAFREFATTEPAFRFIAVAAIITGIRVSALAALQAKDLRVSMEGVPYIRVKSDKTQAGTRDVPIPARLHAPLKAFLSEAGGFGFTTRPDGKGSSDPIRKILTPHLESVGLGDDGLTFHGLRKTLNNFFIREKVPFEARCQFIGHEIEHVNVAVYSEPYTLPELAPLVEPSQIKLLDLIAFP